MATELHVSVSLLRQLYSQPVIHNRKESSPRRNDDAPNKADPPPYDRIPMKDILRAQEAQEDKMMEQDPSIIQAMESRICPAWPVIVDTLARLCDYHHQSFETFINSVDCVLHSACNQVRNRQNQSGSSRGTIYITTPELLACVVASSKIHAHWSRRLKLEDVAIPSTEAIAGSHPHTPLQSPVQTAASQSPVPLAPKRPRSAHRVHVSKPGDTRGSRLRTHSADSSKSERDAYKDHLYGLHGEYSKELEAGLKLHFANGSVLDRVESAESLAQNAEGGRRAGETSRSRRQGTWLLQELVSEFTSANTEADSEVFLRRPRGLSASGGSHRRRGSRSRTREHVDGDDTDAPGLLPGIHLQPLLSPSSPSLPRRDISVAADASSVLDEAPLPPCSVFASAIASTRPAPDTISSHANSDTYGGLSSPGSPRWSSSTRIPSQRGPHAHPMGQGFREHDPRSPLNHDRFASPHVISVVSVASSLHARTPSRSTYGPSGGDSASTRTRQDDPVFRLRNRLRFLGLTPTQLQSLASLTAPHTIAHLEDVECAVLHDLRCHCFYSPRSWWAAADILLQYTAKLLHLPSEAVPALIAVSQALGLRLMQYVPPARLAGHRQTMVAVAVVVEAIKRCGLDKHAYADAGAASRGAHSSISASTAPPPPITLPALTERLLVAVDAPDDARWAACQRTVRLHVGPEGGQRLRAYIRGYVEKREEEEAARNRKIKEEQDKRRMAREATVGALARAPQPVDRPSVRSFAPTPHVVTPVYQQTAFRPYSMRSPLSPPYSHSPQYQPRPQVHTPHSGSYGYQHAVPPLSSPRVIPFAPPQPFAHAQSHAYPQYQHTWSSADPRGRWSSMPAPVAAFVPAFGERLPTPRWRYSDSEGSDEEDARAHVSTVGVGAVDAASMRSDANARDGHRDRDWRVVGRENQKWQGEGTAKSNSLTRNSGRSSGRSVSSSKTSSSSMSFSDFLRESPWQVQFKREP